MPEKLLDEIQTEIIINRALNTIYGQVYNQNKDILYLYQNQLNNLKILDWNDWTYAENLRFR